MVVVVGAVVVVVLGAVVGAAVVVGFGGRGTVVGFGGRGGFAGGGRIVLLDAGVFAVVDGAAVDGVVASVLVTPGMVLGVRIVVGVGPAARTVGGGSV